jgi:hypothetical protein
MCTERIGHAVAAPRQTATVLSRRLLTVADVTALDHLPPVLTAEAWRLQAPLLGASEAAELVSVRPSWVYEAGRTSLLTDWPDAWSHPLHARDARSVAGSSASRPDRSR